MFQKARSPRRRDLNPSLDSLEGRALLNVAMPRPLHHGHAEVHVEARRHHGPLNNGPTITILGTASAGGYTFLNFNGPNAGTNANAGTNDNGISNSGTAVGFDIDNNNAFHNFTVNPLRPNTFQLLNINGSTTAQAFGVNRSGVVVGTDGNGNAFYLKHGKVNTFIPLGGSAATAFGINDHGTIVGQYTINGQMPGFIRLNARKAIRLDAPSGPDTVFAQSINNRGLVVGYYIGTDGNDHGFMVRERHARTGQLTGTAIADPVIPAVPGEPGATFVFSQVLSVNDKGIAVGYYGDSTTSQHGFIYNTNTGQYTFLDDPSEAFHNGVEVTQITGITNSGEITGFYSDANGVFHAFVAGTGMM
jgi:uncharacterized membrane protein